MADPHAWRPKDDVVALYFFRAGTGEITLDEVEHALGIDPGAMRMRIANFKALAGESGLGNVSRQSRAVFEKHGATPDGELRELALRILREGKATRDGQAVGPGAGKPEKLPPLVHVVCGWPLLLVVISGAIGGGLGGAAYALGIMVYRKTRSVPQTFLASLGLGAAAGLLWYVIASAIRG